ncbi:MAG: S-adenosylmethionine:tRNA ribosyltransferase-isomerase [Actinomycetota bacterium]|nr:S-adenosylmethionine:tRNA ribosyltransferase-isomerase [Actinomycetota bacterium]
MTAVEFTLPAELEAQAPAPRRDAVRLLVAAPHELRHAQFGELPQQLEPGDLVVVNTSATFPGAVLGRRSDGRQVMVHFSSELQDGSWLVELRPPVRADGPFRDVSPGDAVLLPDGVMLTVRNAQPAGQSRLWSAQAGIDGGVLRYLAHHGQPIRYAYVPHSHPITDYQTIFAREVGSAEMPSAGRPFTPQIVTELVSRGIAVAPVTLHAGVSSQDSGEPPLAERFLVPPATARLVNSTRRAGSRVVAVGTTVTRALETVADAEGTLHHGGGWTGLVLGPDRPARAVTGLVTGWHAPGASHLQLLQTVAGERLVQDAYDEALRARYRWHEFGDSCLLLP